MSVLESAVEHRLVRRVSEMGGVCWKLSPTACKGIPDRLVILPGGTVVFVELKRDVGELRGAQVLVLQRLEKLGCNIAVLYGTEEVDYWCFNRKKEWEEGRAYEMDGAGISNADGGYDLPPGTDWPVSRHGVR